MKGWISIHRNLQQHYLWEDKPFSKGQAWVDLLLMVNHTDNKTMVGGELIEVKRGSRVTSELKLMERWGWSKSKVRAFLQLLQNDSMIVKKTDRKKTTLTICNYDIWQDNKTTEEPQKNHKKTDKRPIKDTNNNDNKDNNDNKKDISVFFENIWKAYPNKKGKGQISDSQKKKLFKLGEEVILKCISKYKKDKPEWQDYKHGSTFFNKGYIDYLDENYTDKCVEEKKPLPKIPIVYKTLEEWGKIYSDKILDNTGGE